MTSKSFEDKWKLKQIVYDDGPCCISIALFEENDGGIEMAMRWLPNIKTKDKEGKEIECVSRQGSETDWIIIPFGFAKAIGKELIEKKVLGNPKFNEEGFKLMLAWLLNYEAIFDGMTY